MYCSCATKIAFNVTKVEFCAALRGLRHFPVIYVNFSAVARSKAVLTVPIFKQLCNKRDEVLSSLPRSGHQQTNEVHLVRRMYNAEWAPKDPLTLPNIVLELSAQLVINKSDRNVIRFIMCSVLAVIKYLSEEEVGHVRIFFGNNTALLSMCSLRKSLKK